MPCCYNLPGNIATFGLALKHSFIWRNRGENFRHEHHTPSRNCNCMRKLFNSIDRLHKRNNRLNWFNHPTPITSNGWKRSPQTTSNNHYVGISIFTYCRHIMPNAYNSRHSAFGINRPYRCTILCLAFMKTEIGKLTLNYD